MKFLCQQEDLLKSLNLGTRALVTKSTLPILSGLLLEIKENCLYCSSTDLEIGIEAKVPEVSIINPGRVVVPGKIFYDFIRHLPPGKLEMELNEEDNFFNIKGNNSSFQLHVLPVEEFPMLPEGFRELDQLSEKEFGDEQTPVFIIPVDSFREAIRCTTYATVPEDPRPFLSSVLAEFTPGRLRLVGTDINRLVIKEISIEGENEFTTMIPVNSLREMGNILAGESGGHFKIIFYKKILYLLTGDVTFSTRLVDAQYPRYQQVIPEKFDGTAQIKREPFLRALERSSLVDRAVRVNFHPGGIGLSAQEPELGSAYEKVDCVYEGEEVEVGFNALFLLNFLKVITNEEIVFKVASGMKASLMKPADDENYTYVIMPLRMNA